MAHASQRTCLTSQKQNQLLHLTWTLPYSWLVRPKGVGSPQTKTWYAYGQVEEQTDLLLIAAVI